MVQNGNRSGQEENGDQKSKSQTRKQSKLDKNSQDNTNNASFNRKDILKFSTTSSDLLNSEGQQPKQRGHNYLNTGRRSLIKSLVTTTGISALIPKLVRGDKPIEYIKYYRHSNHNRIKQGESPTYDKIYNEMEGSHWGKLKTAENATNELIKYLRKEFGRDRISGIHVGTDYSEGSGLTARYDTSNCGPEISYNQLVEKLPNEVKGEASPKGRSRTFERFFSVESEKIDKIKDDCNGSHFDSDYQQSIPGCSAYQNDSGGICTFGTPAINDNNDKIMITAGHCVDSTTYVYQPDTNSVEDGWVYTYKDQGNIDDCANSVTDWAEIRPKNNANYKYTFSDDSGGYIGDILGTITWTEIQSMAANNENISKRGWRTGSHSGPVQGTDTECNTGTRYLWSQVERGGGDSGGPYYVSEDSDGDLSPEFYIAGIHAGGHVYGCSSGCCGDWYPTGPYIGDIENDLNVNV